MTEMPRAYSVETLADAYAVLAERGSRVRVIAGGTDLMVLMNAHQLAATDFLDIWRVRELRGIRDEGEHLRIGALATYTELIGSPLVQQSAPALVAASRTIGAVQTEALLAGQAITPDLIKQAQQTIAREVSPISDLRSTEHYRRTVTGNVLAKCLRRLGSD